MGLGHRLTAAAVASVVATGLLAGPGMAKGGDDRVITRGSCSAASDWKLKAKPDDGRLQVEFEVDSNRIGQGWNWRIRHDGQTTHKGRRTTLAPSGSFEVKRRVVDAPGEHRISAVGRNKRTGEVCRASLRI